MHPQNLFSLLDEVSTPWIILPRAYRALERDHCRYLPLYLDMIKQSKNEQSLDKWIRIVIEYLANYSIKFANSTCPGEKIRDFVVNGYEAMFWRNLKSPPAGFEDIRVFEHFYNWMTHSGSGLEALNTMVPSAINRMKAVFGAVSITGRRSLAFRFPCAMVVWASSTPETIFGSGPC